MSELVREFNQMVSDLFQKIEDRYLKGELTAQQADDLVRMFQDRLAPIADSAPVNNGGWQQSSWCYDTAWESSSC
jgi:hypothetical protein